MIVPYDFASLTIFSNRALGQGRPGHNARRRRSLNPKLPATDYRNCGLVFHLGALKMQNRLKAGVPIAVTGRAEEPRLMAMRTKQQPPKMSSTTGPWGSSLHGQDERRDAFLM